MREYGKSSPYLWQYYNGSKITLRGMDEHTRTQALGGQFGIIAVSQSEQLSQASWETLTGRATGRGMKATHAQIIGDANPSGPRHWILGRDKRQGGPLAHFVALHVDNPMMYDEQGRETAEGTKRLTPLRNMTGVTRARYLDGLWVGEEGMIYTDFEERIHVVDKPPYAIGPERWIAIDWGFTNPAVVQWWGIDGDARLVCVREWYKTGCTADDIANVLLAHTLPNEIIVSIICDHDGANNAVIERELQTLTTPADKRPGTVAGGIGMLKSRLRVAEDGLPRIFFLKDALIEADEKLANSDRPYSTVTEFPSYVWAPNPEGLPQDKPKKRDDHGMDAMRYQVAAIDGEQGEYVGVL